MLRSHYQELTLCDLVEMLKQKLGNLSLPHLHERTMAVCKLTEGLALIEAKKTLLWRYRFEAATDTQGIMRMFACYDQILTVFVSPDSSA
jgi:hypothetical protein